MKDDHLLRALQSLERETPFSLRRGAGASLAERMGVYATPGASIGVVANGDLETEIGFGVATAGSADPVTSATLFQAGSISKSVFAVAVMRLVVGGMLELDTDVNEYLTSWRVPERCGWTPRITLRQLLSHMAGASVHGFPGYPSTGRWPTLPQVLDGAPPANTPPVVVECLPGLQYRYSGGGISIAQQVVVDVVGRPFPDLMRELVLEPAGMHNSTYEQPLPPAQVARTASGHPWNGVPLPGAWHVYPEMAAAGLWTTAGDLARLGAVMMRTLREERSALGLSRETVAAMLTPQLPGQRVGQNFAGLGWFCDGQGDAFRFGHAGENYGFFARMRMFPSREAGAVAMFNSNQGWPLADEILSALGREYGWPEVLVAPQIVAAPMVKRYVGSYRSEHGALVEIAADENALTLRLGGQEPVALVASSESTFFSTALDLRASFDEGRHSRTLTVIQFGTITRFRHITD